MKGFISKDLHPFWVLLLLLVFMAGGYFVATFLVGVLANWIFGISIFQLMDVVANPASHPQGRDVMLLLQGVLQFISFIVGPLILLRSIGYDVDRHLNWKMHPAAWLVLLSGFLIVIIMPANSAVISWNANLNFPGFMDGFARWARQQEDQLAEIMKLITQFNSVGDLLIGLLVFALIPAIGEELVFRGIVQRQFYRWLDNRHVAIWLAALIFAAIHVQFFGFVPRLLLGALFGYLYFWSGRIVVPMVAHFVNNGFTVVLLYLHQTRAIDVDVESTEAMPLYTILLSLVLSAAVIYYLYQQFGAVPARPEVAAAAPEKDPV
ncbi:CPBP family intramembrane metalloprotease [Pontibacter sp. E15-1]|uniref:CPBP family intramembrane glutamic endopeptidase n=1 Tax=Pontibacter sp. E15-1 TaxID=2919918 RepID=UPI001F4FF921|nr:CPBP family intramembrane glutamic endopeptidase [Pontibacter sp. E15-1]MCJ8166860.1 CPBP family intramembrane metalloprotease [Pontibacter sp. E15-1]